MKKRFLHLADGKANPYLWTPVFRKALSRLGDFTLVENARRLSDREAAALLRRAHVLLTSWGSRRIPASVAANPGRLEYVCHLTGTIRGIVPPEFLDAGIPVTNWGNAPANPVAEGAMVLLLAALKDIHHRTQTVRRGGWHVDDRTHGGSLLGLHVGIYGMGVIGRRFVELLRPFGSVMRVYDPYARRIPAGCIRVRDLEDLFRHSQAVVIHAGLTKETAGSVTARHLSLLPDHGILINTARGAIVDQDALFAELRKGRLRAGLDVLDPDRLRRGHPARRWDNCLFTGHSISMPWPRDNGIPAWKTGVQRICLDNLRRHLRRKPLRFLMDKTRYERST